LRIQFLFDFLESVNNTRNINLDIELMNNTFNEICVDYFNTMLTIIKNNYTEKDKKNENNVSLSGKTAVAKTLTFLRDPIKFETIKQIPKEFLTHTDLEIQKKINFLILNNEVSTQSNKPQKLKTKI
jgi:hypothetical protein